MLRIRLSREKTAGGYTAAIIIATRAVDPPGASSCATSPTKRDQSGSKQHRASRATQTCCPAAAYAHARMSACPGRPVVGAGPRKRHEELLREVRVRRGVAQEGHGAEPRERDSQTEPKRQGHARRPAVPSAPDQRRSTHHRRLRTTTIARPVPTVSDFPPSRRLLGSLREGNPARRRCASSRLRRRSTGLSGQLRPLARERCIVEPCSPARRRYPRGGSGTRRPTTREPTTGTSVPRPPAAASSSSPSRGPSTCRAAPRAPLGRDHRGPRIPRRLGLRPGADRLLDSPLLREHRDAAADHHRSGRHEVLLRGHRLRPGAAPDAAPHQREHRRQRDLHLRYVLQDQRPGRLPRARRRDRSEEAVRALQRHQGGQRLHGARRLRLGSHQGVPRQPSRRPVHFGRRGGLPDRGAAPHGRRGRRGRREARDSLHSPERSHGPDGLRAPGDARGIAEQHQRRRAAVRRPVPSEVLVRRDSVRRRREGDPARDEDLRHAALGRRERRPHLRRRPDDHREVGRAGRHPAVVQGRSPSPTSRSSTSAREIALTDNCVRNP